MKTIKWILLGVALALLTADAIKGTLADETADTKSIDITQHIHQRSVQSDSNTDASNIVSFADYKDFLPVTYETEPVMAANPQQWSTDCSDYLYSEKVGNVIDEFVMVTNEETSTSSAYVRTYFAFEMGDLTEEEFKAAVMINRNMSVWEWSDFTYNVTIEDNRYAIVYATYRCKLDPGCTTNNPSLLQIMLCNTVNNDISGRIDGNYDGQYTIIIGTRAISDNNAWGSDDLTAYPWDITAGAANPYES